MTEHPELGDSQPVRSAEGASRRDFLAAASTCAMIGGLAGGYGTFAYFAGRFLYPTGPTAKGWMFVTQTDTLQSGDSLTYRSPAGERIAITRRGNEGSPADFIALSSVCPHLGCQVHWESANERFFCPCHNGAFDAAGNATAGPPADAGQALLRYPLREENGLLFIEVPIRSLAERDADDAKPTRDGRLG